MRGSRFFMISLVIMLLLTVSFGYCQAKKQFTVVLDAGHGGQDYGAVYGKYIEKNIALSVMLKVGEILEKDASIKVIYTRKTDVFVKLSERANIANKADANFFVSIHCNASKSNAFGTETFVMGTTKIESNLEVAKKENEVITLESDYKMNYGGYDPNSVESVIGLTMLQEAYIEQSIELASMLQAEYTNKLKRHNRGVKQAPFLVLHRTFMPSVLTEIGFISNANEGAYLNSEEGQNKIAESIANGILNQKKGYNTSEDSLFDKKAIKETSEATKSVDDKQFYKIQIVAGKIKKELKSSNFKGLDNISSLYKSGFHKYYYGHTTDYEEAKKLLKTAKEAGYKGSFIVSFKQ